MRRQFLSGGFQSPIQALSSHLGVSKCDIRVNNQLYFVTESLSVIEKCVLRVNKRYYIGVRFRATSYSNSFGPRMKHRFGSGSCLSLIRQLIGQEINLFHYNLWDNFLDNCLSLVNEILREMLWFFRGHRFQVLQFKFYSPSLRVQVLQSSSLKVQVVKLRFYRVQVVQLKFYSSCIGSSITVLS